MSEYSSENLLIRTMSTPNPYALKFVINGSFKNEGKATFNTADEAPSPLVRDMFGIDGVKQVHLFQNTLTVTHSGELVNEDVSDRVCAVIKSRYSVHDPSFGEQEKKKPLRAISGNSEVAAIEDILDRTIRPGLQADGGDIEVISFENNELKITYQGACGGCPSSMMGTLDAIQGILRNEMANPHILVTPV